MNQHGYNPGPEMVPCTTEEIAESWMTAHYFLYGGINPKCKYLKNLKNGEPGFDSNPISEWREDQRKKNSPYTRPKT